MDILIKHSGTRVVSPTGTKNIYRACALPGVDLKQSSGLLAIVIDKEENFNFSLYAFVHTGIHRLQIFKEVSSKVV